jgi:predicted anti-sigma-YlaC factor YlaD
MKHLLPLAVALLLLNGCSLRHMAIEQIGDTLARDSVAFAADDDPELVGAAAPFSLKFIETLLAESPRHKGLLLAAARGFTQYSYAFVQQQAEEAEGSDVSRARALEERARRLYRRARDYGLRGLEEAPEDVALLYWTGAAWAAWIGLSKQDPEALAQLPRAKGLLERALALDEAFEDGAVHLVMMSLDPGRAREHFARATALSRGRHAAPLVALAEAVCVPEQRRAEFQALLKDALRLQPDKNPEHRLANLVAQRRARWLLSRTDELFLD